MKIDFHTPIEYIFEYRGARIHMKRDDLIPFSYGGSKVRIAFSLVNDMEAQGGNYLISYGSPSSNMNRVAAAVAAERGFEAGVIIKKEGRKSFSPDESTAGALREENFPHVPMNERLTKKLRADITYTAPDAVRETIERVYREASERGLRPYYIYGDSSGHGREKVLTAPLIEEYSEILEQEKETGIHFAHIFIAAGTGTSLCGLAMGAYISGRGQDTKIHGISVSRDRETLGKCIDENLLSVLGTKDIDIDCPITDEYLSGGYGRFSGEEAMLIAKMYRDFGIALDPVYSGKAFYGTLKEIEKGELEGDVLFVHTGGYPNFLDSADILNKMTENPSGIC